jgi:uncharacterized protein with HEPN domain
MPPRSWRVRIEDILEAMSNIELYVAGLKYTTFRADRKTVDAVERNLEIIGEATANLPDEILDRWPEVPWRYMRGLRNLLVHEYFGVDLSILWQTVQEDLPPLELNEGARLSHDTAVNISAAA